MDAYLKADDNEQQDDFFGEAFTATSPITVSAILAANGINQAVLLSRYVWQRYEVDISVGHAWSLLDGMPSHAYGFEIALNSRLCERGYFSVDGHNHRDERKVDPLRIAVTLHMPWYGQPFDDAGAPASSFARSKVFDTSCYIQPVDGLAALVAGAA